MTKQLLSVGVILWPDDSKKIPLQLPNNQLRDTDILRVHTTLPVEWSTDWKPLESTDRRSMLGYRRERLACECKEILKDPWGQIYRIPANIPRKERDEYCEQLLQDMHLLNSKLSPQPQFIILAQTDGWFGENDCSPLRKAGMRSVYEEIQLEPKLITIRGKPVPVKPGYSLDHVDVDVWYSPSLKLHHGCLFGKNDTTVDYRAIVAHFELAKT